MRFSLLSIIVVNTMLNMLSWLRYSCTEGIVVVVSGPIVLTDFGSSSAIICDSMFLNFPPVDFDRGLSCFSNSSIRSRLSTISSTMSACSFIPTSRSALRICCVGPSRILGSVSVTGEPSSSKNSVFGTPITSSENSGSILIRLELERNSTHF